jgi:SagB-type dehydrogenase family enzyme
MPKVSGRSALDVTLAYHERTKHHPFRYAAALGYMDWATQPDPFRRFEGAPLLPLDFLEIGPEPRYEAAFTPGRLTPAPPGRAFVSRLFHDSLALSAWKEAGASRWALRVNPSSGNLHPTEGYLVAGPVAGLHPRPAVFHYAPREHALELRAELSDAAWQALASPVPPGAVFVGLTSIYWREAWKYGERAFRYCHHDAGHAVASLAIAAAGLGWQARLLEGVTDAELSLLLGIDEQTGVEAEHPDGLMAIVPQGSRSGDGEWRAFALPEPVSDWAPRAHWHGAPNRLSTDHHRWPAIDEVAAATENQSRGTGESADWRAGVDPLAGAAADSDLPLRRIIHQRRSAVALDARTGLAREAFYQVLRKVLPGQPIPFATLPWRPAVDLLLFVHRVADVTPGLYVLVRDPARRAALQAAMDRPFAWTKPERCPADLPLFLLETGDARRVAQQTSCDQAIAADGAFAAAMLADYRASLEAFGPWHYRRLYWETGVVGQVLYLEAEAKGVRGTGIGCFFDDLSHQVFGLTGDRFQVLYHFTIGGPVEDPRLQTHPPYQHLARARPPIRRPPAATAGAQQANQNRSGAFRRDG